MFRKKPPRTTALLAPPSDGPIRVDRDALGAAAPSSRDGRRTPAAPPRTGRRCRRPARAKRRRSCGRRGLGPQLEQARAVARRHHDERVRARDVVRGHHRRRVARTSTPARAAQPALALIDSSAPAATAAPAAPRAHGKLPRRREVAQQHLGHRRAARVARADEHDGERARGLLLVTGRRGPLLEVMMTARVELALDTNPDHEAHPLGCPHERSEAWSSRRARGRGAAAAARVAARVAAARALPPRRRRAAAAAAPSCRRRRPPSRQRTPCGAARTARASSSSPSPRRRSATSPRSRRRARRGSGSTRTGSRAPRRRPPPTRAARGTSPSSCSA